MILDDLLSGLTSSQPETRLDVVRVLGMLDETQALPRLRERYAVESDAHVREAITWAGKRLYQAQQAGYSTLDEIFRHFRIDAEIETASDETEDELLRRMQDRFDSDLRDMQQRAVRKRIGTALAAGLAGSAVGMSPLGTALHAMKPGAEAAGGNLGGPDLSVKRTPATAPTNAEIDVWLKRLQSAPTPEQREQAVIELQQLNNPRALPALARVFVTGESPKVRQAAQQHGKILYWRAVYWAMTQDGSLAREMQRRAEALGKKLPRAVKDAPAAPDVQTAPPNDQQVDVGDILRKAEEARKKRKRNQ